MAWKDLEFALHPSDLIIDHDDFHYSFDDANITPDTAPFKLGTIVHRPQNSEPTVAWTAVAADVDVVDTNEYAVVYGDHYGFKFDFTPKTIATGKWNGIVVKRNARFKEFYIKQNYKTLLATKYDMLKELMTRQDLLILNDVSDTKA